MGTTVLVVDDHAEFLESAGALLVAEGFEVVGEARSGEEALAAVDRLGPDVVLLDVRLPGLSGLDVAELLAERTSDGPAPLVVLVSSRDAAVYGARLRESPAKGFLTKSELSGDALRRVLAG